MDVKTCKAVEYAVFEADNPMSLEDKISNFLENTTGNWRPTGGVQVVFLPDSSGLLYVQAFTRYMHEAYEL